MNGVIDKSSEKIRIKCLGDSVKEKLSEALSGDTGLKKILKSIIAAPSCDDVDLKKKKREPSEYNKFVGVCTKGMKNVPLRERMKQCAIEWRKKKEAK